MHHCDLPIGESVHIETTEGPFSKYDNIIPAWYDQTKRDEFLVYMKRSGKTPSRIEE